jgi:hypothetical protein
MNGARRCCTRTQQALLAARGAGELSKFVPISRGRITNIVELDMAILVDVVGGPGEDVSLSFFNSSQPAAPAGVVACVLSAAGTARFVYPSAACQ